MLSGNDIDESILQVSILQVSINFSDQNKNKWVEDGFRRQIGCRLRTCFRPGASTKSVNYCHQTDRKKERNRQEVAYVRFNAALVT